jgi:hypothetical protein
VWGVNAQMPTSDPQCNVFWRNGNNWSRNNRYLTNIAVGSALNLWGVNANIGNRQDNIARWNGNTLIPARDS